MEDILIFGDLHLNSKTNIYDILFPIEKLNPQTVVFIGDFFDNSYNIRKVDIRLAYDLIRNISKNIIIITGNHDSFGNDKFKNNIFKLYGFDLVNNINIIYQNDFYIDENFVFIGYHYNYNIFKKNLHEIMEKIKDYNYNKDIYILSHNDIAEFYYGSAKNLFPSVIEIFKSIENFNINYISGHIHDEFFLRKDNINIISIGNFKNNSFRDKINIPNIIYISENNLYLYKYYYNNSIYKKIYIKNFEDIKKVVSFISLYRYINKFIHLSTNDIKIYNYIIHITDNIFNENNMKLLNIKQIKISMEDNMYEQEILYDNDFCINLQANNYNIDDEIYNIIQNYVSDELNIEDTKEKNYIINNMYTRTLDLLSEIINKT